MSEIKTDAIGPWNEEECTINSAKLGDSSSSLEGVFKFSDGKFRFREGGVWRTLDSGGAGVASPDGADHVHEYLENHALSPSSLSVVSYSLPGLGLGLGVDALPAGIKINLPMPLVGFDSDPVMVAAGLDDAYVMSGMMCPFGKLIFSHPIPTKADTTLLSISCTYTLGPGPLDAFAVAISSVPRALPPFHDPLLPAWTPEGATHPLPSTDEGIATLLAEMVRSGSGNVNRFVASANAEAFVYVDGSVPIDDVASHIVIPPLNNMTPDSTHSDSDVMAQPGTHTVEFTLSEPLSIGDNILTIHIWAYGEEADEGLPDGVLNDMFVYIGTRILTSTRIRSD
jgi:hypothetical protein